MTLKQAIESGRPFKRKNAQNWIICPMIWDQESVLATDWIIRGKEYWINVYANDRVVYDSKKEADAHAGPTRIKCIVVQETK